MSSQKDYPDVYTIAPESVPEQRVGQLSREQIEQFFSQVIRQVIHP